MNPIIWLASYPKSGNTWLRTFLANMLADNDDPAYINELRTGSIASARHPFDIHTGLEASDLTADEIDLLRPGVYRRMAELSSQTGFHKVHDAYTSNDAGEPLFPTDSTAGAVYLIRNPLDVAPSYAHHSALGIEWAVEVMGDSGHNMSDGPRRLQIQFRQKMGTWSDHVVSWVDDAPFPVEVVRYEDMHLDAENTFTRVARFMGLNDDAVAIRRAIEFSSFEVLQSQEREHGFAERNPRSESFFRQGRTGTWRETLTEDQAAAIINDHRDVMERFGYLQQDSPVF